MASRVRLDNTAFAELFPFHVAFDRDLRLIQCGRSLLRLDPMLVAGSALASHLRVRRPELALDFDALVAKRGALVLLEHLRSGLRLRGQIVALEGGSAAVFIGSPWLTNPDELATFRLSVEDFATHDPVVDLLHMVQAQKLAAEDHERLAQRLARSRNELQSANLLLSERNAELLDAQARLHEREAEYRKLAMVAARTDNAVVVTDALGRVEWINEGFTRLTGYGLDEGRGRTPGSVLQCEDTDRRTVEFIRGEVAALRGFSAELLNRAKSGRNYWISIEAQPIRDSEGRVTNFMAIERDITRERQASRGTELQLTTHRVLASARRARETTELVPLICQHLAMQIGMFFETRSGRCRQLWSTPGFDASAIERALHEQPFDLAAEPEGDRLAAGDPCCSPDLAQIANPPPRLRAAIAAGLRGALTLPVQLDGRTIGVFEFLGTRREICSDELLTALRSVGNQLSQHAGRMAERRRAERLSDEMQAIFDFSPEGLVAFREGDRVFTNPAFHALTGVASASDAMRDQRSFDALMTTLCDAETPWVPIASQPDGAVTVVRLRQPRSTVLTCSLHRLPESQGRPIGQLLILRDVTRESEVDRMKTEFLSTAAHELRTPMASIHGFTELLLAREFDEQTRRDVLETIHRQSSLLVDMVNDLLDLARIEARAGVELSLAPQPLAAALREAVEALMVRNDSREVVVHVPDRSPIVQADGDRLAQVLMNVLSNAYKYSPGGGAIQASVVARSDESGAAWAGIEVSDEGIGMSPDQLARIFERFYRADPSGAIPGTGLGMSLVKELMERMHGKVEVRSELGRGTTVALWLPAAGHEPSRAGRRARAKPPSGTPRGPTSGKTRSARTPRPPRSRRGDSA